MAILVRFKAIDIFERIWYHTLEHDHVICGAWFGALDASGALFIFLLTYKHYYDKLSMQTKIFKTILTITRRCGIVNTLIGIRGAIQHQLNISQQAFYVWVPLTPSIGRFLVKVARSMSIQAIETEYKGYKFRSRLEARWAVFFDAMNIKWVYEQEGFENDKGERYLPDFYLPDQNMWCEVKPYDETREQEIEKAESFITRDGRIRALLFLPNIPQDECENNVYWYACSYYDNIRNQVPTAWITFLDAGIIDFNFLLRLDMWLESEKSLRCWDTIPDTKMCTRHRTIILNDGELRNNAYKKARQARFEHGQKP